jgi:hypothetical protein
VSVDLACHVALENADDLALREPFGEAALEVVAGAWLGAEAGEHDPPQRMVRVRAEDEETTRGFDGFGIIVDTTEGGAEALFDDLVETELLPK